MLTRMLNDYAPLAPLSHLQDEMNRLFEHFFEDMPATRGYGTTYPGVNLWDAGECAWVEAELPGMSLNDIEVLCMGNELTIQGNRRIAEPRDATWHRRERAQGQFSRVLTLPWEIDTEHVEAKFLDGVLTIKLPKAASSRSKKVKVLPA